MKLNPSSETVRDLGKRMLALCKEMAGPSEEIELYLTLERASLNFAKVKDRTARVACAVPMCVHMQPRRCLFGSHVLCGVCVCVCL